METVSFEVAKLAKEIGFQELCLHYFFENGTLVENSIQTTVGMDYGADIEYEHEDMIDNWNVKSKKTFSAPIQSQLQKWLRDERGFIIYITPYTADYYTFGIYGKSKTIDIIVLHGRVIGRKGDKPKNFDTYEEALEAGLKSALGLMQ